MRDVFEQLISFVQNSTFVKNLSETVERSLDRLEGGHDEFSDSRHIETAVRDALGQHAGNVQVVRNSGETDDELRQRIKLEIAILNSRGTIGDVQGIFQNETWIDSFATWDDRKTEIIEKHDVGLDAYFQINLDTDLINNFFEGTFGYAYTDGTVDDSSIEGYNEGVYSGSKKSVAVSLIKDTIKRIRAAGIQTRLFQEGEFGYAYTDHTVDDPTIKGYDFGRYSNFVGGTF